MQDPVWNVKLYGGRGSTPVCEPGFQKYGGNTTCIYVDLLINDRSKMLVIFDAGTGIRLLSNDIEKGKIPKTEYIFMIFTHLHWDHASGIEDFPQVPVWVQQAEYDQAMAGSAPAFLHSQIDDETINWHFIELMKGEYEGFVKSLDVYGDGSIVLVDMSGHSAGQIGIFLTISSGKRFFFIGDTTWTIKGVADNADRPAVLSWLVKVNWNDDMNIAQIQTVHDLHYNRPDITVVPAHDEIVAKGLPAFPAFLY